MNHAVVTLDETGSMRGQEERVVSALNQYVNALPKGTNLTVFKFDSKRWVTQFAGFAKGWKPLTLKDYRPGAWTPYSNLPVPWFQSGIGPFPPYVPPWGTIAKVISRLPSKNPVIP